jgi:stage III sporulation protein AF
MSELRGWVINICTAVFFITAVEMLLPNNNMKKYVKFVLGLILITVIINPLVIFLNKGQDINTFINSSTTYMDGLESKANEATKYKDSSIDDTLNEFKKNIENLCVEQLKIKYPSYDYEVKADVGFNNEKNTYEIKGLSIAVSDHSIDKIQKVQIGDSSSNTSEKNVSTSLANDIKEYISQEFKVSKSIITVTKLKT